MRVVLDTNVFVSGVFFGGVPGRILSAWGSGEVTLVLSPAILAEYRRVGEELGAEYPERTAALAPVLALVATTAVMIDAPRSRSRWAATRTTRCFSPQPWRRSREWSCPATATCCASPVGARFACAPREHSTDEYLAG